MVERCLSIARGLFQSRDLRLQVGVVRVGCQLFLRFLQRHLCGGGGNLGLLLFWTQAAGFLRLQAGDIGFYRAIIFRCARLGRLGFLGGFQSCCFFGASLTVTFFLFGFTLQAFLAVLKALLGVIRFVLLQIQRTDIRLGCAVVLHQRDTAGANVRASAALNAVKQILPLELIVLFAQCKKVQLLRQ